MRCIQIQRVYSNNKGAPISIYHMTSTTLIVSCLSFYSNLFTMWIGLVCLKNKYPFPTKKRKGGKSLEYSSSRFLRYIAGWFVEERFKLKEPADESSGKMFYSPELLSRKGRFFWIWLAATCKNPTVFTRSFNARTVAKIDVSRVVDDILAIVLNQCPENIPRSMSDPPRFSLYLSSLLLHGTCKVLDRQASTLFNELGSICQKIAELRWNETKSGLFSSKTKKSTKKNSSDKNDERRAAAQHSKVDIDVELMMSFEDELNEGADEPLVFSHSVPNEQITLSEDSLELQKRLECDYDEFFELSDTVEAGKKLQLLLLSFTSEEEIPDPDMVDYEVARARSMIEQLDREEPSKIREIPITSQIVDTEAVPPAVDTQHQPEGDMIQIDDQPQKALPEEISAAIPEHMEIQERELITDQSRDVLGIGTMPEALDAVAEEEEIIQPQGGVIRDDAGIVQEAESDHLMELPTIDPAEALPRRRRRIRRLQVDDIIKIPTEEFRQQVNDLTETCTLEENLIYPKPRGLEQMYFNQPGRVIQMSRGIKTLFTRHFVTSARPDFTLRQDLEARRQDPSNTAQQHSKSSSKISDVLLASSTVDFSLIQRDLTPILDELGTSTMEGHVGDVEEPPRVEPYQMDKETVGHLEYDQPVAISTPLQMDVERAEQLEHDQSIISEDTFMPVSSRASPDTAQRKRKLLTHSRAESHALLEPKRKKRNGEKDEEEPPQRPSGLSPGIRSLQQDAVEESPIIDPAGQIAPQLSPQTPQQPPETLQQSPQALQQSPQQTLPETPLSERWEGDAIAARVFELCGLSDSSTISFAALCPPTSTSKRQAVRTFTTLLSMHKEKLISLHQDHIDGKPGPVMIEKLN